MTMRSHVSSFPNVCGPSVFQNCRLHFTFTALDTIWTLLYHTMLKFRPYHKFWCFNEKLPMIFHFWCIPSHVFICSFELCEKVDRKKKLIVKISNLSTKRVVRKCSDCVIWSVYVHPFLHLLENNVNIDRQHGYGSISTVSTDFFPPLLKHWFWPKGKNRLWHFETDFWLGNSFNSIRNS